jgi:hypothetical protein
MVYSCIRILAEKEGVAYAGFSKRISAPQQSGALNTTDVS